MPILGRPGRRAGFALLLLLAALIGGGVVHRVGPRRTPPGQPALATLDSLEPVRAAFDGARDRDRLLVLLSPT